MIEVVLTGKDLVARFRVVRIVEHDQQAALGQGFWDQAPERGPESMPGQFLRRHEGVIATQPVVHWAMERERARPKSDSLAPATPRYSHVETTATL